MPEIKLYIATTLDGYIARENGSLDWLLSWENPNNTDHGYNEFMSGIDTIIMGRKTYDDVLGFGIPWPYPGQKTYVITTDREKPVETENTRLIHDVNSEIIQSIKNESKKNIWLAGGSEIIGHFLGLDAVDEITVSIVPVLLGGGIRLFREKIPETKFILTRTESFETGIVNLTCHKVVN